MFKNLLKFHYSSKKFVYVTQYQNNLRLDNLLRDQFNRDWNSSQKIIRLGEINVDGKKIRNPAYRIKEGQTLQLPQFLFENEEHIESFQMEPKQLSEVYSQELNDPEKAYEAFKDMIIYEDSSLIAINKPAGYSSQGGHKADFNIPHLGYNYVKGTFKIVHRLDQNVSGLMFVTKSRNFASYFGKLLEDKENLVKEYICVVKEIPKMKRALVDTPLRFDKNKNKTVLSSSLDKDSKSAKTEYECLNDSQVLKVRIYEGRKHQIRVHLSQVVGCPILFDYQYGYKDWEGEKRQSDMNHIYLHSFQSIIKNKSENGQRMIKHIQNKLIEQKEYTKIDEDNILIKNEQGEIRIQNEQIVFRATLPEYLRKILDEHRIVI